MNNEPIVIVKKLKDYFELKQVTGDETSLQRRIIVQDINRPGFELSGYTGSSELKRVILLGNKEIHYIARLDEKTQRERFAFITDEETPCIICSNGHKAPKVLVEMATEKNFPVFETDLETYRLTVDIISLLDKELSKTELIHGVLLNVYGFGVLIRGKSGIGKSEVALEMIKRGHVLVADDAVEIMKYHNELHGQSVQSIRNYLEIRGIGVMDLSRMYGAGVLLDETTIDLVIDLVKYEEVEEFDRIGDSSKTIEIMGLDIPYAVIPVTEGRSLGVIMEAAVLNYKMKRDGYDSSEEFRQKIYNQILSNREDK